MKPRILMLAFVILSLFMVTPNLNDAKASPVKSPMTVVDKVTAISVPIVGTFPTGNFTGNLDINRFVTRNGQIFAVGTLTGTLTDLLGNVIGTVTRNISIPLTAITGTCQILHLELGPLDLNLLGLRVQLNRVVLDITAQQGGGLLGDLLCAVANLLNGGGPLSGLTRLLNQILGQL